MEISTILPLILEWQNLISETSGIYRTYQGELYDLIGSKPIKIITGFRRSGKSFLVQRTASQIIKEKKIEKKNILYLNFEDYQSFDINDARSLDSVFKLFLNQISIRGKKLLIFDEVKNIENWDRFVRTIYEKYNDIEIILTGSNSELLSSEIGSNLAGRFIEIHILPFDFKEFLLLRGYEIKNDIEYYENIDILQKCFNEFLLYGGLPEMASISSESAKKSYLLGILSKVVLDDIVNRFSVRNPEIIEQIIKYLFIGTGNLINNKRIYSHLKGSGYNIKYDTVLNYIDHIIKTFALYPLEKLDYKQSRIFKTIKKYYAVDTGFTPLFGGYMRNYSRLLENAVFLKLKRSYSQIAFGQNKSGKEIDFVVLDNEISNYQVKTELNENNINRELSSFASIDNYIKEGNHFILTSDPKEEIKDYSGIKIRKRNIIKWMLDIVNEMEN